MDFFQGPAPGVGATKRPLAATVGGPRDAVVLRHGHEEAVSSRDLASFLRAHEHAFIAVGGMPASSATTT